MNEAATTGVLDVGCFSARLTVVRNGDSRLRPVLSHKTRLHLDRALDLAGRLRPEGIDSVVAAVRTANRVAARHGVSDIFALATSSVRDARNADEVVERVHCETGTHLRFLSGTREAQLSYVAARRWFGASAGPLAVVDIGGGTVELAAGHGSDAEFALSLGLGAREVTRTWFGADTASATAVARLRAHALEHVRDALGNAEHQLHGYHTVGSSKVLRQLARLAGTARRGSPEGELCVEDLREWIPRLAAMPATRRGELPGISRPRARQALAGAVVAEALLTVFGGRARICPWSTTQGLLLTMVEQRRPQHRGPSRSVA